MALRVSLRYALLFTMVTAVALAVVYWNSSKYIEAQIEVGLSSELNAFALQATKHPLADLIHSVDEHVETQGPDHRYYLLLDKHGQRLAGNLKQWPDDFAADGATHNLWLSDHLIPGERDNDDEFATAAALTLAGGARLFIAQGSTKVEALTDHTLNTILIVLAAAAVIAIVMGIRMGSTMLRRVDGINATLGAIMEGDLGRRIAVSGRGDEFDALAERLNAMLARIEKLMKGMRQVTENVAHDLRSPLNRLRSRLEVTLLRRRDERQYVSAIEDTVDELEQLLRTFNAMLRIAQAESGAYRADFHEVDLSELAGDMVDLYRTLAEEKSQTLTVSAPQDVIVIGDRDLLAQMLGNLVENAIKFTPNGGTIEAAVSSVGQEAVLTVTDSGPGIPAADRERVFDRFTRLDPARSTPGNGLGLSLVRAITRIHGATITLDENHPGLKVEIRFPLCATFSPSA